jgi:hypothetical protein
MKLKILVIAVCCLCVGCSEEPKHKKYRLELFDNIGRSVRVVEATEVTVYLEGIITFHLANGHECYWKGSFFAEEIR